MRQKAIVARSARSQPALGGGHLARQFIRTADNTPMSCRPGRPTPNQTLGGGHLARQSIRTADNTQGSCRPGRPTPNQTWGSGILPASSSVPPTTHR